MKWGKGNEIIKVVMATMLSIGLFSVAFVGANHIVFAVACNQVETLPRLEAIRDTSVAEVRPLENYQRPTIFVYEESPNFYVKSANALSPQEAAELGAQYIWEVFGESIDGKKVEMFYSGHPSQTRAYWHGSVADSSVARENVSQEAIFRFTLDAVTGERLGINKDFDQQWDGIQKEPLEKPQETQSQMDEYAQIAAEYAQRHFNQSTVTSAIFSYDAYAPVIRPNGKIAFDVRLLIFTVSDQTGRDAEVAISAETKELFSIDTTYDDLVPGFNAETGEGVG